MLCYFGSTFFSLMKIMEANNTTSLRKALLLISYVVFVANIIIPVLLTILIYRRFEILKVKEAKQSFNTLLLKIDKASKWRIANPSYFFGRRLLTAILLTLPIDNTFIFLQYVFILMSSHMYILYMVAFKPYQTATINSYVLANETFYSALIIAIFIFSDATPEMNIKFGAAVALITSLVLIIVGNLIYNLFVVIRGPVKLKLDINESKLKRAEKEALERAEDEERRLKKKKEEEEFTKLHDETQQLSMAEAGVNGTMAVPGTTMQGPSGGSDPSDPDSKPKKGGKKGGKKGKGQDDDVVNADGVGGVSSEDFNAPKSKHRKRNDKEKARQDDVVEGVGGDEGSVDGEKRRKRRKRKTVDPDAVENPVEDSQQDPGEAGGKDYF
jgi:hypothetical protein